MIFSLNGAFLAEPDPLLFRIEVVILVRNGTLDVLNTLFTKLINLKNPIQTDIFIFEQISQLLFDFLYRQLEVLTAGSASVHNNKKSARFSQT